MQREACIVRPSALATAPQVRIQFLILFLEVFVPLITASGPLGLIL
jgi:hypothetical protein